MINVLIADNQALTREGIIALLSPVKDIRIIGSAATIAELQALSNKHQAQVIVMDHHFNTDGINNLAEYFSPAQLLILYNNQQRNEIQELKERGVKSYLSKACERDELISAIYATGKAEEFFCLKTLAVLSGNELPAIKAEAIAQLSTRETEIVYLIADGLANKEIAERLYLSVHTIKTHRKNIIKKLGFTFKNAAELVLLLDSLNEFI